MKCIELQSIRPQEALRFAVQALQKGKVVVSPTDTVYGLLADATNPEAVKRVCAVKRRDEKKPLPVFVGSFAMARKFAKIDKQEQAYLKRVWPGKVTVVLESKGLLPKELEGEQKIGLRIPKHPFVRRLLRAMGKPLIATSANISGLPPARKSREVREQFQRRSKKPDVFLDAGDLLFSRPSRVVDITGTKPRLLRR